MPATHRQQAAVAACYAALAAALRPPTMEQLQALVAWTGSGLWTLAAQMTPGPDLGRHLERLAEEVRNACASPEALEQLAQDHARLFSGPYHLEAPPYESLYVHASGQVMGEATAAVRRLYAEAGLALAEEWRDLPDHLVAELSFMAHLCQAVARRGARGRWAAAQRWQHRFLQEHLARWLPLLRQRLAAARACPFYLAAVGAAETLVLAHLEVLRAGQGESPNG